MGVSEIVNEATISFVYSDNGVTMQQLVGRCPGRWRVDVDISDTRDAALTWALEIVNDAIRTPQGMKYRSSGS